ncbi:DUF551 domain-containing protein [Klebsiella pneumoniae]|uniref:DUF551 domain-containing protein n=1 Tax=Klebsiella pneumoniae TaxID=573 RepID=UPI001D12C67B|nr:DUF551 domain-containing protein [Klebsiella pneumoniae]
MTKSTITRERIQLIILVINSEAYDEEEIKEWLSSDEIMELSRMALAAMDSESECLQLDYLQGHKDGLEWAAQLAEANHPETGDWLYDDPIELAKAIRKGPDMPPAQSVADSEPVIVVGDDGGDALSYRRLIQSFEPGTKLYRHAQPVPAVPGKWIPVSEQMPEVGVKVLCFPVKDEPIHATFNGQLWLQDISWSGSDEPIDNVIPTSVTHWMPLPAAPQEVRGE